MIDGTIAEKIKLYTFRGDRRGRNDDLRGIQRPRVSLKEIQNQILYSFHVTAHGVRVREKEGASGLLIVRPAVLLSIIFAFNRERLRSIKIFVSSCV